MQQLPTRVESESRAAVTDSSFFFSLHCGEEESKYADVLVGLFYKQREGERGVLFTAMFLPRL